MSHIKNYIGISRDHSASMQGIAVAAAKDYNQNINAIKQEAINQSQDTIVSVVKCGTGRPARNEFEVSLASVTALKPLTESPYGYVADGSSTPLFDSVGELIDSFKKVPDYNEETVSFLVMVITDGDDNSSWKWTGTSLGDEIRRLQATDRWTFVFRVPRGYKRTLMGLGIPEGNILEWDQTTKGVEVATQATTTAMKSFYSARASGLRSTETFYADMSKVSAKTVKSSLTDISAEVSIWPVLPQEVGCQIKDFCDKRLGNTPMLKGAAFYQLTKPERKVQDYKKIVIRDKKSKMIYGGAAARDLLGLPHVGDVKLVPGANGNFDIFIQSTSTNRKLMADSSVLYWPKGI